MLSVSENAETRLGLVVATETEQVYGRTIDYRWEGGPICHVDISFAKELGWDEKIGSRIALGPYRVRVLSIDHSWGHLVCIRDEPRWWTLYAKLRFSNWFMRQVKWRIVLTLAIWNMARKPRTDELIGWHLVRERWHVGRGDAN